MIDLRFWPKVKVSDGCWEWIGALNNRGYGKIRYQGRAAYAHRVSWEISIGPIPESMVIDHLCLNPQCVRPDHLETVTMLENSKRGTGCAGRTHCVNGHPFDSENIYVPPGRVRACRECQRIRNRASYSRRAERLSRRGKAPVVVTGHRFGKLVLVRDAGFPPGTKDRHRLGVFKCDCGKYKTAEIRRVRDGVIQSCGCIKRHSLCPRARWW